MKNRQEDLIQGMNKQLDFWFKDISRSHNNGSTSFKISYVIQLLNKMREAWDFEKKSYTKETLELFLLTGGLLSFLESIFQNDMCETEDGTAIGNIRLGNEQTLGEMIEKKLKEFNTKFEKSKDALL